MMAADEACNLARTTGDDQERRRALIAGSLAGIVALGGVAAICARLF
jgi:hypothetical protein